jgi:hypothetical protein
MVVCLPAYLHLCESAHHFSKDDLIDFPKRSIDGRILQKITNMNKMTPLLN